MKELNLEIVKEFDFNAEDIVEFAGEFLPDTESDGEFDEFMHGVVDNIAADMDAEVDMCDAFYDTYPTKEVEEFMAEDKTLEQAIVAYLESKIEYIKEYA